MKTLILVLIISLIGNITSQAQTGERIVI